MVALLPSARKLVKINLLQRKQNQRRKQPLLYSNQGQDAHANGKLEEAVKLYSQALAADETLWQAQMQLTSAYYSLNRLPEARTSINKVLTQLKEFPESHELKQTASKAETLSGDIALASTQPVEAKPHINVRLI